MEIAQQFGIDGKLLAVQLINFAILVFVFWKFILPRITKMLAERSEQISSSLEEARKAREEAAKAADEREKHAEQAQAEAATLLKEVRDQAETERQTRLTEAKNEADRVLERAREQLEGDRTRLRTELRAELAGLAVETTRQVLDQVVTAKERNRLLEAAVTKINRQVPTKPRARAKAAPKRKAARGRR